MKYPPIDRLKAQLLTSNLQTNNQALFQVINQLIDAMRQTIDATQADVTNINNSVVNVQLTGYPSQLGHGGF